MFKNAIDLTQIFTIQNVLIYIITINIITFLAMWIDKRKAQKGKWRISEKALFTLVLLGGGLGGIIGMYTFRHKTKKMSFVVGFPLIFILEIILIAVVIL
mgnify:CR=1 FL=1